MEDKALGFAKKDLIVGDIINLELCLKCGLIHSEEINCFESITIQDFIK